LPSPVLPGLTGSFAQVLNQWFRPWPSSYHTDFHKHSASTSDINGCHFFHMEEFSDTPLLHTHLHVRFQSVRLSLCWHLSHGNKMQWDIGGKAPPLVPSHQHPPLMSWTNIIKQEALLSEQPSSICFPEEPNKLLAALPRSLICTLHLKFRSPCSQRPIFIMSFHWPALLDPSVQLFA